MGAIGTSILNPDWSRVSQFVSLFQTAADTARAVTGQTFKSQQTTLGFHLIPDKTSFRNALSRFVNLANLDAEGAKMFGVSAYFDDFSFVIDASAVFPEGVFIKLNRTYSGEVRFEQMADTIHKDEESVLRLLGLKIQ